jgi:4-hydroxy-tetrahydrodipicolinate reductase
VIVDREIRTDALTVPAGHAAGVQQIGRGWVGDEEKLTLLFRAAVGEKDPHDTVEIKGNPDVNSTIAGGVNGDVATCAITINAVRQIVKAASGLRTMIDVPLVSCRD